MSQMNLLDIVRYYSDNIEDGRSNEDIFDHLKKESVELGAEIFSENMGYDPGDDGIVGESVDVIVCALDLIFKDKPDITNNEILEIVSRKLEKWKTKTEAGAYK